VSRFGLIYGFNHHPTPSAAPDAAFCARLADSGCAWIRGLYHRWKSRSMPRKRRAGWSKKRKSRSAVDPTWYTIKAILQERVVDGKLEYLIDWDNHPQTGEVYPHEWVSLGL
jgi:hypothetical protein